MSEVISTVSTDASKGKGKGKGGEGAGEGAGGTGIGVSKETGTGVSTGTGTGTGTGVSAGTVAGVGVVVEGVQEGEWDEEKWSVSESEYKKYVKDSDIEDYLRGKKRRCHVGSGHPAQPTSPLHTNQPIL